MHKKDPVFGWKPGPFLRLERMVFQIAAGLCVAGFYGTKESARLRCVRFLCGNGGGV